MRAGRLCHLAAWLSAMAAVALAAPYYLPQQRQFYSAAPSLQYYSPFLQQPQQQRYQYQYTPFAPAPFAPAPFAFRPQVYYAPHAGSNLISPLRSQQQPLAYVQYPGSPVPVLLDDGTESGAEGGGWGQTFQNWLANSPLSQYFGPSKPAEAAEASPDGGSSPAEATGASATKGDGDKKDKDDEKEHKEPAKEDDKKESEPKKESADANKLKYNLLAADPQFFGQFGLLPQPLAAVNPALAVPSASHGAVSSYLFLKNLPFAGPQPFPTTVGVQPEQQQQPESLKAAVAGESALDYKRLLQAAAARQQKDMDDAEADVVEDDAAAVTVEAGIKDAAPVPASDDDDETGPTIAQAKPRAVALAGVGGVAAAAPVGTALVGPGGMALSAPEATAVAGAKHGAGTSNPTAAAVLTPATHKQLKKAMRTHQLASHNFQYLLDF